jgi:hypothetical protein
VIGAIFRARFGQQGNQLSGAQTEDNKRAQEDDNKDGGADPSPGR